VHETGVLMKTRTIAKTALGISAILLGLTVAPMTMAASAAAVVVNVPCSGGDGGAAGLIAAITTANVGGGVINLASGCTYTLTAVNNTRSNPAFPASGPPNLGPNGLPLVTSSILINGKNTTIARSSESRMPFRIFEVDGPSGNLGLKGLTITGGSSPAFAGGIFNDEGSVALINTNVTDNSAANGPGGGIASGIGPDHPTDVGPIGTLTLTNSQVDDNSAPGGGGGGILDIAGTLRLNNSQVDDNSAANGGGIAAGNGNGGGPNSVLTLINSQVNDNTATSSLGGPGGGGIASAGTATLIGSQVDGNTAPGGIGGGIINHGTMTIINSQVNDNSAPNDGADPPNAGIGGGIANIDFGPPGSGVLSVFASQVNDNSASELGGGIAEASESEQGPPGPGNDLTLSLSQVTGNSSPAGGGIFAIPGSPVTLTATPVVGNTVDNCEPLGTISGCVG
jgi:hypothetical protein